MALKMWGGRSLVALAVRCWVWGLLYVGHYLIETGFSRLCEQALMQNSLDVRCGLRYAWYLHWSQLTVRAWRLYRNLCGRSLHCRLWIGFHPDLKQNLLDCMGRFGWYPFSKYVFLPPCLMNYGGSCDIETNPQ